MRPNTPTLLLCTLLLCTLLLACPACARRGGGANTPPANAASQATARPTPSATCRLLAASDVSAVQGEEPADAQGSEHLVGGLSMSQCFYRLPTFSKSVNLEVIRPAAGSTPDAVREFWRQRFHPDAIKERERQRELKEEREREHERELKRERERGQVREGGHGEKEEEEEESARPQRVAGVGDEAYWSGNQITSALSVLSKDTVVRISVGGPEDQPTKIRKASELARKVLKQL